MFFKRNKNNEIGVYGLLNNIPVKICGRYIGHAVSELVLGNEMARKIKRMKGRFIVKIGNVFREAQLYYFNEEEYLFIGQEPTLEIDFETNINNPLPGTLGEGKNFVVKGCD